MKKFDPDAVAAELCSVQPMNKDLIRNCLDVCKNKPSIYIGTDIETIRDLSLLVCNKIESIKSRMKSLEDTELDSDQLKRLEKLFKVLDRLSTEI